MKKGIVAFIILAAIPFFVSSISLAYTSPGKPTGFVNDFAGMLSASEKTELETTLSNFEKQTTNEIAVVTIPALGDETIESYAVKLFEDWKIGKAGKDNGILLLISRDDRQMRIEVGYGLEGDLVDSQASLIIRKILAPAFKEGNYGEGIEAAVRRIVEVLNGAPDIVSQDTSKESEGGIGVIIYLVFFIPIWLASILGRSKSWWAGGIIGAIAGIIVGAFFGFVFTGIIAIVVLAILGFIFDFFVSSAYQISKANHTRPPWWTGGGGFGGSGGGGFGGFGGGGSGGGGASGGW